MKNHNSARAFRIGIAGPVGSGKAALVVAATAKRSL
jgi:Ni2+-binding GTPase involved in maturation of urease and hydrogenase